MPIIDPPIPVSRKKIDPPYYYVKVINPHDSKPMVPFGKKIYPICRGQLLYL